VTDCLAVEVGFGSGSIRTEDLGPMGLYKTPQQDRADQAFALRCMLFVFILIIALVIENLMK
jgi:hypothetical protein